MSGIGLVVALPREIPTGFVRIDNRQSIESHTPAIYCFAPTAAMHVAVQAGVGRKRAADGARLLIQRFSPRALVSFGFAGGLMPELLRGTLIIGTEVMSADSPRKFVAADRDLIRQVQTAADAEKLPVQQGLLITTRDPITDPVSKAEWWEKSGACAVDMETTGIVEVAHEAGLPWVAVRAIVDSASDSLPKACLTLLREDGHIATGRLMQAMYRSPRLLWPFLRLAGGMTAARRHLFQTFERWTKNLTV